MSEPEQPRFNLRLTPDLKAELARAQKKSGRSMNAEILARLSLTFEPDPVLRLAEVLRPFLASVPESDQAKFVDLAAGAVDILSRGAKRKK